MIVHIRVGFWEPCKSHKVRNSVKTPYQTNNWQPKYRALFLSPAPPGGTTVTANTTSLQPAPPRDISASAAFRGIFDRPAANRDWGKSIDWPLLLSCSQRRHFSSAIALCGTPAPRDAKWRWEAKEWNAFLPPSAGRSFRMDPYARQRLIGRGQARGSMHLDRHPWRNFQRWSLALLARARSWALKIGLKDCCSDAGCMESRLESAHPCWRNGLSGLMFRKAKRSNLPQYCPRNRQESEKWTGFAPQDFTQDTAAQPIAQTHRRPRERQ